VLLEPSSGTFVIQKHGSTAADHECINFDIKTKRELASTNDKECLPNQAA
jgi:hypothetical protein